MLLVVVQSAGAMIGPMGVSICREADDSSHIQVIGTACSPCGTGANSSMECCLTSESGDEGCSCVGCTDEPVDQILGVRLVRGDQVPPELTAPIMVCTGIVGCLLDQVWTGSRRSFAVCQPPERAVLSSLLGLRATILLL